MTNAVSNSTRPDNGNPRHEPDTVSAVGMALAGLGMLVLLLVTLGVVAAAFKWLIPSPPLVTTRQQVQRENLNPGVQPNQAYDRQRIEAAEREVLSSYGWQDRQRGMARIPIERAMKLMAQRKLQVNWPQQQQEESASSREPISDVEPQ